MAENGKPNGGQFKPGAEWRGNPGGRPRMKPVSDAYRLFVSNVAEFERKVHPELKKVVRGMFNKWREGDAKAGQEITNRIEGKVPSINVEVAGDVDGWTKEELQSYASGGPIPERFKHVIENASDTD